MKRVAAVIIALLCVHVHGRSFPPLSHRLGASTQNHRLCNKSIFASARPHATGNIRGGGRVQSLANAQPDAVADADPRSHWQLRRRLRHAAVAGLYLAVPAVKQRFTSTDVAVLGSLVVSLLFWTELLVQMQQTSQFLAELLKALRAHRPTVVKSAVGRDPATRTAKLAVKVNIFLTIVQIIAGVQGHSTALVADAMHTMSDVASDLVTLWAVQVAQLPPDRDHPYGHGRVESVASLLVSLMLLGVGGSIGSYALSCVRYVLRGSGGRAASSPLGVAQQSLPSLATLVTAAVTIIAKEWLYRHTVAVGTRLNSPVLVASAWHHRADALSSVLTFAAIAAALTTGLAWVDGVAGLLVAVMILSTAAQLTTGALAQLLDTVDPTFASSILEAVTRNVEGVEGVDNVRTRAIGGVAGDNAAGTAGHGLQQLVDLTVYVDASMTIAAADEIATRVRHIVKSTHPNVAEVFVQLQPHGASTRLVG